MSHPAVPTLSEAKKGLSLKRLIDADMVVTYVAAVVVFAPAIIAFIVK